MKTRTITWVKTKVTGGYCWVNEKTLDNEGG